MEAATAQVKRNSFEIGQRLCELKEKCAHGEWLVALGQVSYSEDTAQNLMRIYREYDPTVRAFQELNYSQLVALFPVPMDQRKEFVEENDLSGLSTRDIKKLIKQKEDAEKRADQACLQVNDLAKKLEGMQNQKSVEKSKKQLESPQAPYEA